MTKNNITAINGYMIHAIFFLFSFSSATVLDFSINASLIIIITSAIAMMKAQIAKNSGLKRMSFALHIKNISINIIISDRSIDRECLNTLTAARWVGVIGRVNE